MVDVVHWFMNLTRPLTAVAGGGIYLYDDGRDTPDNVNFIVEYPEKLNVTFEATITDMIGRESADIVFMGMGGRLSIFFRYGYRFIPSKQNQQTPEATVQGVNDTHMDNWLDCMVAASNPMPTW